MKAASIGKQRCFLPFVATWLLCSACASAARIARDKGVIADQLQPNAHHVMEGHSHAHKVNTTTTDQVNATIGSDIPPPLAAMTCGCLIGVAQQAFKSNKANVQRQELVDLLLKQVDLLKEHIVHHTQAEGGEQFLEVMHLAQQMDEIKFCFAQTQSESTLQLQFHQILSYYVPFFERLLDTKGGRSSLNAQASAGDMKESELCRLRHFQESLAEAQDCTKSVACPFENQEAKQEFENFEGTAAVTCLVMKQERKYFTSDGKYLDDPDFQEAAYGGAAAALISSFAHKATKGPMMIINPLKMIALRSFARWGTIASVGEISANVAVGAAHGLGLAFLGGMANAACRHAVGAAFPKLNEMNAKEQQAAKQAEKMNEHCSILSSELPGATAEYAA